MTGDGEALFRAICEHPREDTPRLVYADWLTENGDADRAELIRLQCEAWSLSPAYPTVADARTRASELLRAHRDRWDAELLGIPGLTWGELYVRGFVDTAHISRFSGVTVTLKCIFANAPLRFLTVAGLFPGDLRELLDFPHLGRLTRLNLPGIWGSDAKLVIAAQKRFPNTEIV